jgi:hypothetical protein
MHALSKLYQEQVLVVFLPYRYIDRHKVATSGVCATTAVALAVAWLRCQRCRQYLKFNSHARRTHTTRQLELDRQSYLAHICSDFCSVRPEPVLAIESSFCWLAVSFGSRSRVRAHHTAPPSSTAALQTETERSHVNRKRTQLRNAAGKQTGRSSHF